MLLVYTSASGADLCSPLDHSLLFEKYNVDFILYIIHVQHRENENKIKFLVLKQKVNISQRSDIFLV